MNTVWKRPLVRCNNKQNMDEYSVGAFINYKVHCKALERTTKPICSAIRRTVSFAERWQQRQFGLLWKAGNDVLLKGTVSQPGSINPTLGRKKPILACCKMASSWTRLCRNSTVLGNLGPPYVRHRVPSDAMAMIYRSKAGLLDQCSEVVRA